MFLAKLSRIKPTNLVCAYCCFKGQHWRRIPTLWLTVVSKISTHKKKKAKQKPQYSSVHANPSGSRLVFFFYNLQKLLHLQWFFSTACRWSPLAFISTQPLQYLPAPYILEAQWLSKPWKN